MTSVVVTGAAGFIGSHLVDRLLAAGHQVTGVDDYDPWYPRHIKEMNLAAVQGHPAFRFVEENLAEFESDVLASLFRGADVVFHLAARPGVQQSWGRDFLETSLRTIVASQSVFEAAVAAGTPRVVYASSSSVYGESSVATGDRAVRPTSPYGAAKAAVENLAAVYRPLGLDAVGLRYFTVYGRRQRPDMAMHGIIAAALPGDAVFRLRGDGTQRRSFTHVDDVVRATVAAGWADAGGLILDIGGGEVASVNDVIDGVSTLLGQPVRLTYEPEAAGDPETTVADVADTADVLDWKPEVDLAMGLRDQVDWQRA